MVCRLTKGVLRMLRLAQALIKYAHPLLMYAHLQLRLKQQRLPSAD